MEFESLYILRRIVWKCIVGSSSEEVWWLVNWLGAKGRIDSFKLAGQQRKSQSIHSFNPMACTYGRKEGLIVMSVLIECKIKEVKESECYIFFITSCYGENIYLRYVYLRVFWNRVPQKWDETMCVCDTLFGWQLKWQPFENWLQWNRTYTSFCVSIFFSFFLFSAPRLSMLLLL